MWTTAVRARRASAWAAASAKATSNGHARSGAQDVSQGGCHNWFTSLLVSCAIREVLEVRENRPARATYVLSDRDTADGTSKYIYIILTKRNPVTTAARAAHVY